MTSTTDMTGHPDVMEISDLVEGLLTPARTTDLRRHLDTCELCADVHASLQEIRGLLGSLPGPTPIPDDVAQRIDDALTAEAHRVAETPPNEPPADTTGTTVHVSRETSAPDRPAGHARTAGSGPGRKERKRRGRRKIAVLGIVFGAAALGLGSVLVPSLLNDGSDQTGAGGQRSTAADTFSATTLEQQVSALLTQSKGSRAPDTLGIEGGAASASPRVLQRPTVPACVEKAIGKQDAPLATERGVYHGRDVLLVVLPDTSDSTRVTAYLVDATCVEQPSAQAKVLLQDTYVHP
ncbi:anti-sigma factor family protein [Streptomyces sp. NPDC018693]|uniref:anti-sigma factor family protein n=1 Tax=unclassified Streptomyces TaxID=2593676 RepID=UPI0037BA1703